MKVKVTADLFPNTGWRADTEHRQLVFTLAAHHSPTSHDTNRLHGTSIPRTASVKVSDVWKYPTMLSYKESIDEIPTSTSIYPTLKPALSPSVEINITIVYITLYALLFLFVYVQLWMIWYYRHKRFSYQTVFLFCCLVWSGLRTTLFSFYFEDCELANDLPISLYWLLYCFPVCLQFTMLCLLVLFFAQVRKILEV